ncbi:insulinase family protein [Rhizobium sp. G187]|uniref:M16 family metallopeptidase n=1 Tax=Rhizobium sp. G187 TaxID=3451352 RepID=UPI003EE5F99C
MFRRLLVAIPLLLLTTPAPAADPGWDPRIATGRLDNGLRYFLHDSGKDNDPFNIRLIVHAGSIDEAVPSGVAHILEHMVFQSNTARGRSMHAEIEALGWRTGVQVNAVTRETETQFMLRTRPDDALDLAASLKFTADLVLQPSLRAEDWDKERFVILEELRQTESLPDRVSRLKKAALRPGSRYVDRPTIGTAAGISKTSIADIRSFYQTFYRASNMTLIVSGRFDTEAARRAVEQAFGAAPAREAPLRDYRVLPLKQGLNVALVQDPNGSSSQVTYAFRVAMPDRLTEAGQLAYLQQYFLTRLIRDAVEAEAPHHKDVAEALTFVTQEPTEERLILAFNARTETHGAATSAILETVERLRREGLSRTGFEALLSRARQVNENNREAAESRSYADWEDRIASAVLTGSVVDNPATRTQRTAALFDRITLESLNARLRELLAAEDQVLFYQVPGGRNDVALPAVEAVTAERDRLAAMDTLPAHAPLAEAPPAEIAPTWPADLTVETSGHIVSETRATDPDVIEWQLSNGDTVVWLVRDTPDGKVYLSGQSLPGFRNSEFGSIASQAALQLFTQSGFRFWNQTQYDLWVDAQTQRWSFALKDGHLDAGIAAAPADLPARLRTYAATLAYGAVRPEAVEAMREQMGHDDNGSADDSDDKASAIREQLLYGSAYEDSGNLDTLAALAPTEMTRIADAHLGQPVTWYAVGAAPDTAIRTAFASVIGAVPRKATLTPDIALQQPGRHAVKTQVFAENRARVEISFYAPLDWTPEASFIVSSLTPLAQQGLKKELRNVLGGIYSLEFELALEPDQDRAIGTLGFYCDPDRADELTQAALAVLDRMPEIARAADTDKMRADIAFAEGSRLTDPNTWLRRLALSYRRYGDAGYLKRMQGLGEKITPQRLEAHAKHIFRTENVAVLTKLPLAPITGKTEVE